MFLLVNSRLEIISKFRVLYPVTFFHVSSQGQFDVFHRDSTVRSFLKAHDVIENKRVSALWSSGEFEGPVL